MTGDVNMEIGFCSERYHSFGGDCTDGDRRYCFQMAGPYKPACMGRGHASDADHWPRDLCRWDCACLCNVSMALRTAGQKNESLIFRLFLCWKTVYHALSIKKRPDGKSTKYLSGVCRANSPPVSFARYPTRISQSSGCSSNQRTA